MSFPQPSVTDSFNRANETPIGGNWTQFSAAPNPMRLISNQLTGTPGNYSKSIYTGTTISRPCDIYMTCVSGFTGGGLQEVDFLTTQASTSPWNGHRIYTNFPNSGSLQLRRISNGDFDYSLEFPTGQGDIINGDSFGVRMRIEEIEVWFKPSGGQWIMIGTSDDDLHRSGYPIAPGTDGLGAAIWDDVGFGAITVDVIRQIDRSLYPKPNMRYP